jgi:hypothetical protein
MIRDDVMERLRVADPLEEGATDGFAESPAGRALLERTLRRRERRLGLRARWLALAAATGAVAVAAWTALPAGDGGEAAAAETLRPAAAAIASAAAAPGPGEYLYTRSRGPPLPATLYEVAARIPGVQLVGAVRDPAGRRGVAVALVDEQGIRSELVFDPETSALLAERDVLAERVPKPDAAPGTMIGHTTYLETAVVGSTSERP